MVVFVDDNLRDVKNYLESIGYEVKSPGNGRGDVYIYSGSKGSISNIQSTIDTGTNGCFLINADEMTIDEILYSLNHRTYSPLF